MGKYLFPFTRGSITHAQNTELRQIKKTQHREIKRLATRTSQNTRVNQCAREGIRSIIHIVDFGKTPISAKTTITSHLN
jgi:hypothetical protein